MKQINDDESQFIGSINVPTFAPTAVRPENVNAKIKSDKQKEILTALQPGIEIFRKVVKAEEAKADSVSEYMKPYSESKPNGDELYYEFRARQMYIKRLQNLLRLLERAAAAEETG